MNDFIHTFFDWSQIKAVLPSLLSEGIWNTLLIASLALLLALVLGLLVAILLISPNRWVRLPGRIYVDILRGLPAILTVSLVGIGLPLAGIAPFGQSPLGYAVVAVGLISAAYIAEIFRSGIQSVAAGQAEAGRSLGMSYLQTLTLIVVPQGVRNVLPALANQFIVAVKESALVYLLGLSVGERELFFIAQQRQAVTYNSSSFTAAAMCYLLITIPLTYAVNWLDRRLRDGRDRRSVPAVLAPDPVGGEPALLSATGPAMVLDPSIEGTS
ncbi:MAG TPA: amino acid ABC transporter permease [Pseudonocardiaceae bacterium]|jgi:polar amino acid transport system permease protein|nr:amino acid ABC transporter permease [Pseudonocardiaceae bacterium]